MRFKEIESQQLFRAATEQIDSHIAKAGFCPRRFFEEITRYMLKNSDLSDSDRTVQVYWHKEIGVHDHRDIHKEYYQNEKGESVHISFKIADNISERNAVHFGGSSESARKQFSSVINKLRRLAKTANADLQHAEDVFNDTPEGILKSLDDALRKVQTDMIHLIEGRRNGNNYRQIQRSTGSDRSQYYYEQHNSGMIGRITYTTGNCGWRDKSPLEPTVSAFFEDAAIHAQLVELLKPLEPLQERFRVEVKEAWEQDQIIKRLKGELPYDDEDHPF